MSVHPVSSRQPYAATLPKKKLLVILGAGSSMPCGMPSVADIDIKMKEWCREWKPHPNVSFVSGCIRWEVFTNLWDMLEEYYRRRERVNFENVLGEMIALAYWVTPAPFGNALRLAVQNAQLSSRFPWSSPPPSDALHLPQITIRDQLAYLLGKLAGYMRERTNALNINGPEFQKYRCILSRLRDEFEVGVYNLNYDNVAISAWRDASACPDAFTGFRGGKFDARTVSVRKQWEFIYHLHGSVHYSLASEQRANISWVEDLTRDHFVDSAPLVPTSSEEFKPLVTTTLIVGAFKLDQLLADPFQTFYASLIRHAHEADAVLIAGYGFGDVHVNRALQNRLSFAPDSDSPLPSVVVVTKSDASCQQMGIRQNSDIWAQRLGQTLNTTFDLHQPAPKELIEQNQFEKDNRGHVRIWHGGFLEILGCVEQVIAQLHPKAA